MRDDHRQGGLAEPGWASQKDVIGGAILHRRSLQQKLELTAHLGLTDELGERARPQGTLEGQFGLGLGGWADDRFRFGHCEFTA